jgi:Ca2+-binding RTX toxin-like protein
MRRLLGTLVPLALLTTAAAAAASTSHEGWPKIDGDLIMHKADENGEIRATKVDRHNELLGGHGNDTIVGGNVGDVLWGDYKPGGQPTSQTDTMSGGGGRDFIYASHGTNVIDTGPGSDVVHAHFGRGSITCHSARTIVFISHRSKPHYRLSGCRRISFKTLGR